MRIRTFTHGLALLCSCTGAALAATPDQPVDGDPAQIAVSDFYTIGGGEVRIKFNTSFLDGYGISVDMPEAPSGQRQRDTGFSVFSTTRADGLQFAAKQGRLDRFIGGLLRVEGEFKVLLPNGETIVYDGFQLKASRTHPMRFELVGSDGQAWFYVNHLMYLLVDDGARFDMRAADLRATPAFARRAGFPELAGVYVGGLHMTVDVLSRGAGGMGVVRGGTPNFHGEPFSGGGIYEADVLMQNYDMEVMRCRMSGGGTCDGNGPDDGEVVFAPNSTLRNTNNPNTADIPWYEKFNGDVNPYGYPYPNADQHPFLIWNLYRIVDGQLEQIAASGVKHAFLTTNVGCASPFGNNILSPDCSDTYGTGNNDSSSDLGPRSEIIPADGWFGRCGSIFDTNCDGNPNQVSFDGYRDRLIARESQLATAGAQYFSDSWYIVQDDIDIYNTMMHRSIAPAAGGGGWTPGSQGAETTGPLINAWVDPAANPTQNVEIDDEEGHTRIAVKVKQLDACPDGSGLSGTCYRYDYAVHNFDFARATTQGEPPNLRIISNPGFRSFTIPTGGLAVHLVDDAHFADDDIDAGNNWAATIGDPGITWTAPVGNELNWGTLYRFSFVTALAPDPQMTADVSLAVADDANPDVLTATMMVPQGEGNDVIFRHDFELPTR